MRADVVKELPLQEERFGFEPEVTALLAHRSRRDPLRLARAAHLVHAALGERGKKTVAEDQDAFRAAVYCILRYGLVPPRERKLPERAPVKLVSIRRVTAAIVALAAVGMLRIIWLHFASEPTHEPRRMPIDQPVPGAAQPGSRRRGRIRLRPARGDAPQEDLGDAGDAHVLARPSSRLAPLVLRYDDARRRS